MDHNHDLITLLSLFFLLVVHTAHHIKTLYRFKIIFYTFLAEAKKRGEFIGIASPNGQGNRGGEFSLNDIELIILRGVAGNFWGIREVSNIQGDNCLSGFPSLRRLDRCLMDMTLDSTPLTERFRPIFSDEGYGYLLLMVGKGLLTRAYGTPRP
jgi:hypothetical protein